IAFGRLLPESWKITMPMSGSYTKSEIEVEPDAAQEVERAKIGNTLTTNKTFSTSFSKSKLPLLSLNYSQNETTKDLIESKYNILNESLNSSASYSIDFQKTIFGEMIGFKYIPLLNKIPAGKELKVNLNYQYNYTIDDKNYILGSEQSAFDKFTTYYKKIGVISRPFNWIRLQPELALTDKYHRTKLYDGLENKIQQASLNVDINKFLGLKPSFDFGRTEDLRYDISRPDSEPTENYNYNAGIRLDVYPVDWWKLLKFIDSRFNVSGKYTETLNVDQIIKTKDSSINGTFGVDVSLRPKEIWKYLEFITMTYSYNNNVSAVYSKISNNYDFNDIFKDYFDKYFWLWKDKAYTQLSDTIDLQFNRTSASNAQTHSFNGQLFLWSPLNLRYNYNFKNSFSQVQGSENYNNTRNIQLNSRLDLVKGLKWFKNTRRSSLNLDYSYSEDENGNFKQSITEVLTHNSTLGLEVVWTEKFNTSFSMNFPQSKKNMQTEYGVSVEKSFSYSPKISWSYYTANPFKLFKPFTKKQWLFQNKLNLNGSFSYSLQKAELLRTDNILQKTQDAMQYGATFGAQYDMSDFLRLSADSKFNINKDNINENNDYTEYSFSIKTIIIF
ncbi:MAG TPA: hypothetical protein PLJ38_00395, partial [bacterium]|nr:hypothetical protein [bacterium]